MNDIQLAKKMGINWSRDLPELENPDPMAFPKLENPGLAGYFANCYSEILESSYEYFFISFLTSLGNVISGRCTLNIELEPQPRLYVILLGESGMARKSTAISKCIDFFIKNIEGFKYCWGVGSAEGLQREVMSQNNDNSIKSLMLALDEFKLFTDKSKIDGSVLLPCVNTLFESNFYHNSTKARSIKLENAHLSVLAASTINTFKTIFSSQFLNIGFVNRLFIVPGHSDRVFSLPEKLNSDTYAKLRDGLHMVLEHVKENPELKFDKDAGEFYHNWYVNLENSEMSVRLDTLALRFMILIAVNSLKDRISLSVAKDVIKIMDWQLEQRKSFWPYDFVSNVAYLEQAIRQYMKKEKTAKKRNIMHAVNYARYGIDNFDRAINNLVKYKEIEQGEYGTYRINN